LIYRTPTRTNDFVFPFTVSLICAFLTFLFIHLFVYCDQIKIIVSLFFPHRSVEYHLGVRLLCVHLILSFYWNFIVVCQRFQTILCLCVCGFLSNRNHSIFDWREKQWRIHILIITRKERAKVCCHCHQKMIWIIIFLCSYFFPLNFYFFDML
jgi:hypothetical protein